MNCRARFLCWFMLILGGFRNSFGKLSAPEKACFRERAIFEFLIPLPRISYGFRGSRTPQIIKTCLLNDTDFRDSFLMRIIRFILLFGSDLVSQGTSKWMSKFHCKMTRVSEALPDLGPQKPEIREEGAWTHFAIHLAFHWLWHWPFARHRTHPKFVS